MAYKNKLTTHISANATQFNSELNKASTKMKNFGRNMAQSSKGASGSFNMMSGSSKGFTSALGGAGIAAVGVIMILGRLTKAMMGMAVAADEQLKGQTKVNTAIRSTGGAANLASEELFAMARGLQQMSRYGDEDILNNVTAQLLTFTNIAGNEFKRAQTVVLDLSTVLDADLKSSAIQLGKALNDPIANLSALSRSGIQFSLTQKTLIKSLWETGEQAKAQGLILEELERQYGGQAKAAGNIGLGPWTKMKNLMGDIREDIGKRMLPLFTQFANWFITTWPQVKIFFENSRRASVGFQNELIGLWNESDAFRGIIVVITSSVKVSFRIWRAFFEMMVTSMKVLKDLFIAVFDKDIKIKDVIKNWFGDVKTLGLQMGEDIVKSVKKGISSVKNPKLMIDVIYTSSGGTPGSVSKSEVTPNQGTSIRTSINPDSTDYFGDIPTLDQGAFEIFDRSDALLAEQDRIKELREQYKGLGMQIQTSLMYGSESWKEFGKNSAAIIRDLITQESALILTKAITIAFSGAAAMGPVGLVAIPALVGLAMGLANTAINSIGGFATGGIVPGSSYSGDHVGAMVNSGEMILSRGQQGNLFNMINGTGGTGRGSQVEFVIDGTNLVGVLNNVQKRNGVM